MKRDLERDQLIWKETKQQVVLTLLPHASVDIHTYIHTYIHRYAYILHTHNTYIHMYVCGAYPSFACLRWQKRFFVLQTVEDALASQDASVHNSAGVCACVYACVCACMCLWEREREYALLSRTPQCITQQACVCAHVRVHVSVWEREREYALVSRTPQCITQQVCVRACVRACVCKRERESMRWCLECLSA